MAVRKPLVVIDGQVQQLPDGDSLPSQVIGDLDSLPPAHEDLVPLAVAILQDGDLFYVEDDYVDDEYVGAESFGVWRKITFDKFKEWVNGV